MEFFSGWSTALVLLFACMFYTNGLLFEKIKDDNQRIAASYVAILTICGVACHFGGRQFREGWDPNFSFLRSYKTIITICIVWTLSLRFREFDKLHAATVLTLFTVCWFGTHWGKLTQEARRKAAEERRQAKLREMAAANNAGGANNNKGKAVTSGNSSKPKKQR